MNHPFFIIELKADFSLDDCIEFLNSVTEKGEKIFQSLYVALPFFRLKEITAAFPDSGITFGTSLINDSSLGAFTKGIAGKMIKDAGGKFTLVGTSYERNRLQITDEQLEAKLKEAKKAGLKPIYVVGGGHEISEESLIKQLELLKTSQVTEDAPHPTVIFEGDFKNFEQYLPSGQELNESANLVQKALETVFDTSSEKFAILAALPSDLIGFSSLIDTLPFKGAFFTKSGTYPHSVHDETVKLLHVHCEDEKETNL